MNRESWAIVPILLIFIVLSQYAIHEQSRELWFDEAFSMQTAYMIQEGQVTFQEHDVHPPFYYMILSSWLEIPHSLGDVEWARWLSVIFMSLFLLYVFDGLRTIFSFRVAWATTLALAMASTYVHYGTEIRMYALVLMFSAVVFSAIMEWRENNHWAMYWAILLGVVVLPFIHYFAAMAFMFFTVFAVVLKEKKLAVSIFIAGMVGTLGAFFIYALPQLSRAEGMWFQHSTLGSWSSAIAYSFYVPQGNLFGNLYGSVFIVFIAISFIGLGIALWLMFKNKKDLKDKVIVMFILTSLFPFLGLLSGALLSWVLGPGFGNLYHHRLFLVVTWMFAAGLFAFFFQWVFSAVKGVVDSGVKVIAGIALFVALLMLFFGPYEDSLHYELERTLDHIPCGGVTVVHESPFSGAPAIVTDRLRGCDNRHVVMSDLNELQGHTAGYDAWPEEDILWGLTLPSESSFYFVRSLSDNGGIETIKEEWQQEVYVDDGIVLMLVRVERPIVLEAEDGTAK